MAKRKRVALLSAYDKTGIVEFAQALRALNFRIVASGGTAAALKAASVPVQDVKAWVGGAAILGHKVVTLSREIHAALLADYLTELDELSALGLQPIDLVYCNLYPLQEAASREGATKESVLKQTDIGGPTMLRSGGKGGRIVVCDPADQQPVLDWLAAGEPDREEFLNRLFVKVETMIGVYCLVSATFHSKGAVKAIVGVQTREYCYGENGYQVPALAFSNASDYPLADERFEQVGGSPLSFNNGRDLYRLTWTMSTAVHVMRQNANAYPFVAVGVKHGNACGAGFSLDDPNEAIHRMVEGDPLAMFGGSVMLNFNLDDQGAEILATHCQPDGKRQKYDCIIAADISEEARKAMERKGDKCRLLRNSALDGPLYMNPATMISPQHGGFGLQPGYQPIPAYTDRRWQWSTAITWEEQLALYFGWSICITSNSNTITLVTRHGKMIANGVGQTARVYAAQLAIERARTGRHNTNGALAVSDSYFPELDGPSILANAGIKIVQTTSGSIKDQSVRDFFSRHNVICGMIPDEIGRGFAFHG